ncbi:hypothetical protein [Actinocorallia populi]|uniref:hypothetical protein n=1 Tax=Actinocorallia populi TaxID=2079200 RepID=UPI000D08DABB|nr:hypothetical protein [Actinocorallia populi]
MRPSPSPSPTPRVSPSTSPPSSRAAEGPSAARRRGRPRRWPAGNEAHASAVSARRRELGIGVDRLNTCGDAIALGHPLGGGGARTVTASSACRRAGTPGPAPRRGRTGRANTTTFERL